MFLRKTLFAGVALCLFASSISVAQVPRIISYQGVLTDSVGLVLPDSTYRLSFSIDSTSTVSSSPLWTSTREVAITSGRVSVLLGENAPILCAFDKQYWLFVTLKRTSGDVAFPGVKLGAAPYAFRADTANVAIRVVGLEDSLSRKADKRQIDSLVTADSVYARSASSPANVLYVTSGGNLGIGTQTGITSKLTISGGDILLTEPGAGILLSNAEGTPFKLSVSDSGMVVLDSL